MNPYLKRLREQYDALRASIEGLQTRAAEEKRDLDEAELRSVTEQGDQAKRLAEQIENLTAIETRNRHVDELRHKLLGDQADDDEAGAGSGEGGGEQHRSTGAGQRGKSATKNRDRDPGHYTRTSRHSFFGDLYRSRATGDDIAQRRLHEHARALDTTGEGVGIVPPHWLTEEFEALARQGRRLANAVRQIPLGDDPRPITLPRQTAGTEAVVAEQATENAPILGTDAWDSDVDVVTPKPTAGKQIVSRQMIDMSSPAIDLLLYGDLLAVYADRVEAKVGASVIAAAGAAVTTFATEAAFGADDAALDSVIDLQLAVRNARKLPADLLVMTVNRWGKFKKLRDTTGRPLIPSSTAGPMNVAGVGSVAMDGQIEDLGVISTDAIGNGITYPESYLAIRAADTILFESNVVRFRFEEVQGPESVILGVWGYTAVISRQAGKSVKRAVVTAAA